MRRVNVYGQRDRPVWPLGGILTLSSAFPASRDTLPHPCRHCTISCLSCSASTATSQQLSAAWSTVIPVMSHFRIPLTTTLSAHQWQCQRPAAPDWLGCTQWSSRHLLTCHRRQRRTGHDNTRSTLPFQTCTGMYQTKLPLPLMARCRHSAARPTLTHRFTNLYPPNSPHHMQT